MNPDEIAALRAADAGGHDRRQWFVAAAVAVLLTVLPLGLWAAFEKTGADHLLGRVEEVTAQVDRVERIGSCRRDAIPRYEVTLAWSSDVPPGSGTLEKCREAPQVGASIQAWVTADGHVTDESPALVRTGLGLVGLALAAATLGVGGLTPVPSRNRRRRLREADTGSLGPAVPVNVGLAIKGEARMTWTGADGSAWTARPRTVVRTTKNGYTSGRSHRLPPSGRWWLHAAPAADPRHRHGLLVRGSERCWIEFRPRTR
ncbi:MAG: hypothetical protein ACTHXO_10275 [Actinomycetaceae bacterium]